ncbi:MAG: heat-inducible transcription repressor HrcA [Deltaproteobacteria bacterium CG_4_9_14_3_um_filter_44_9]|nr:MAG: heat-inducible transcription repressor HrcA [Deltaproteobacteria bacterium CG06_land_8_20_14_3_00_44_19]PJB39915.1 MAG: heat-inducible transcription repressor HrcA [Deltaproteobacteria bacterium CG_4_9_14_3_um_filter_44_9]HCX89439.1 heat-inducible transcription repressor HrcA [Deltaproteobacteria bacterium]
MAETLLERSTNILHAIINEYILTGEPVGSRTISKKYNLSLSPASIRNAMADLEEMGLLSQPHTSAGRIPTDEGLRYYVDCILKVRELTKQEKETIKSRYRPLNLEITDVMKETSLVLSKISRYTGIVLAPKFNNRIFKHIEFIKLNENQILIVFVSKAGIVDNKVVEIEENLSQDELYKFTRYLNEILTDLTLSEVREKIIDEMKKESNMYDRLLSRALKISQKVFGNYREDDIYIGGKCNIFEFPEFCDVEKMKTILRTFEEKNILIKLLDKAMETDGIQIFIGTESQSQEMKGCSIVISPYTWKDYALGTLGVIGPTRMNYCDVVPIVNYTAKMVSKIMDTRY